MEDSEKISQLLAIGLDSNLAQKVVAAGYSLSNLKSATNKSDFSKHFSIKEVERIQEAVKRKPIPKKTLTQLIEECDWKCCLCWDYKKESPVIIHHIEEHSKTHNDSYDNLVILCPDHHAKAHSKWEISRSPYPSELIRNKKKEWIKAVAEFKAGRRPAPGCEPPLPTFKTATAPPPPRNFIGRRQYCDNLSTALIAGRTVALHGMGGIGKTATAQQVAMELNNHFSGGTFWGPLADYGGNLRPILRNWFYTCSQNFPDELDLNSLVHLIRELFTDRQDESGPLLIIIDDVRQEWLDSAQLLKLALPVKASLLLTTRDEKLAIALDTEPYHLNPMSPDEALDLLKAHAGSFLLSRESDITSMLLEVVGYLPLAIELIGKQLIFLGRKPGYHLETLYQAVGKSASESLVMPGYPGLAATFAITYEALSVEEQRLFRWLGIFAGGQLYVSDIAGVTGLDAAEVEEMLDEMVACALLSWGKTKETYKIHPLLHQYVQTLLGNESTEAKEAEQRYLDYYLTFVQANAQETRVAHDKLESVLPDIMAAINFALGIEAHEVVHVFAMMLWGDSRFLSTRGYYREALDLLSKALVVCQKAGDRSSESIYLNYLGAVHSLLGLETQAVDLFQQALSICRELGDRYNECADLGNLGLTYLNMGEWELAIECFEEALTISQEVGNLDATINQLGNLGTAFRQLRRLDEASILYQRALTMCQQSGNRLNEGNNLSNLGLIYFDWGQLDKATELIKTALDISREVGDRKGEGNRLGHLGNIHCRKGEVEQAIDYYEQAIKINREIGHPFKEGYWLGGLGNAYRILEQPDQAIKILEQALKISQEIKSVENERLCLLNLGGVYGDLNQWERAISYFEQSFIVSHKMKNKIGEKASLDNLGLAHSCLGNLKQAISYYEQALVISREIGDLPGERATLDKLASVYNSLGEIKQVIHFHEQSLVVTRKMNDQPGEAVRLNDLAIIYSRRGELTKVLNYWKRALEISDEVNSKHLKSIILNELGVHYRTLGQVRQAIDYYNQALSIYLDTGNRAGEGIVLGDLGVAYFYLKDIEHATEYLERALIINREVNNRSTEGFVLGNLGNVYHVLGNIEDAINYHEQALTIGREVGDRFHEANWLGALGQDYHSIQKIEQSISYYQQCLSISQATGNIRLESKSLESLITAYFDLGKIELSKEYLEQAVTIDQQIDNLHLESHHLLKLGVVYQVSGNIEQAKQCFERALSISREIKDAQDEAAACWNLGLLYQDSDPTYAVQLMSVAVAYKQEFGHPDAEEFAKEMDEIRFRHKLQ